MSEPSGSVDLRPLLRRQQRVVEDMASLRDDMAVMTALVQRMNGTMSGLVHEVGAMRSRDTRLDRRVGQLEDWRDFQPPTP